MDLSNGSNPRTISLVHICGIWENIPWIPILNSKKVHEAQASLTEETCIYTYTKRTPESTCGNRAKKRRPARGTISKAGNGRRDCRRCGCIDVANRARLRLFVAVPVLGRDFLRRVHHHQQVSPSNGRLAARNVSPAKRVRHDKDSDNNSKQKKVGEYFKQLFPHRHHAEILGEDAQEDCEEEGQYYCAA
jgi:hypothetical protein